MPDNRMCQPSHGKESICIDTYRVLDSCRDKDCFENVKVYLTEFGEEIIDRTCNIRAKSAEVVCAYIDVNDVPFNRGFYQLNIKIYTKITFEACLGPRNIQEFDGIAVVEKKVILFGSEGNVRVFKSEVGNGGFCSDSPCQVPSSSNLPIAVLETVDPVILDTKIVEPRVFPCCCCCCVDDIPDNVCAHISGALCEKDEKALVVSLGFFSVVRIERPAQLIINATEYNIPEKECISAPENDPCTLFKAMSFPVNEFSPPSMNCFPQAPPCKNKYEGPHHGGCGCS